LDAELLLDHILCQDEYCNEWAEDTWSHITPEARQDLTTELRALFNRWMDKWKERPTFYSIKNSKQVTREEAIQQGLADPIPE